jgi:TolB-like protein
MHDYAGRHRSLPTAVGALVGEGFGLQQPSSALAATRADKPFWPTTLEKLPRSRSFRRKAAEYFADGMVEEIITALSRIRWLFVIARNSSFTYKGQAVD